MKKTISEDTFMSPVPIPSDMKNNFQQKRKYEIHPGVDIPVPSGTEIKSPANGLVKTASPNHNSMCGGTIDIDYGNGFWSRFCHVKRINVNVGDMVKKGQVVGLSGGGSNDSGRGNSTGPHLHFTLKKDDRPVNPLEYMDRFDIGNQEFPMTGSTQSQDKSYWDEFFSKDILAKSQPKLDPLLKSILSPLETALNIQKESREYIHKIDEDFDLLNGKNITSTKYLVAPNHEMYSPESGKVILVTDKAPCQKGVLIKHIIENTTYYSKFCNVKTNLTPNKSVRKGDEIGIAGSDATIEILDKRNNPIKLNYLPKFKGKDDEVNKDSNKKKESYPMDPLLSLALKPLKLLDLPLDVNAPAMGKNPPPEPYKFVKWIKNLRKESVNEQMKNIKRLL